ncbi:hypothetical protein HI113_15680 [Corallococcus exiguus]|uniref:hypothetical protein n=1 Tax=Corallococcus TaxID=83461 RepID=UPI000ECCA3B9|nr:hypothetical protein [Corallococcus sp. AB032C]NNB89176.1 hypothetical protein [Corallococcus exiguus]NNB95338.1 hypothetical protein [Corallococcus exiguus]NPC48210.1 hypothetical protein [Corallococcus exiguus]RKH85421.1 hypothetical protein D7X99_06195 [Corallococcus sp. AB032C]
MKTVTYERSGQTNTGAQALRVEGLKHLRVLEQGEPVVERDLTPEEIHRLAPLLEPLQQEPEPATLAPQAGSPDILAVTLAFEDEETPRLRLATERLPAKGGGYDRLLAELDALLSAELHARAPRHAHAVLPHQLRHDE